MTETRNPTVLRRRLGAELRRLREEAGLTIERVAATLECSESKVSRIETGQVGAMPRDVRDMLDLYGVGPEQRDTLIQIARDARQKGWWHAYTDVPVVPGYIGLEAAATQISTYEALLVPGLLQDPDYSRAVIRALRPDLRPHQLDRWVEFRGARQGRLRRDDPPAISAVVDEAALRRSVGGRPVMRRQVQRLIDDSALDAVALQVLPFGVGEHAGLQGSFTILGFQDPDQPDVVYLEDAELCLPQDRNLRRFARRFQRLRHSALGPLASRRWLAELLKEL